MSMPDTQREARTLIHYFQRLYLAAGIAWDHDCHVEIEEAVQGIADAAVQSALREMRLDARSRMEE